MGERLKPQRECFEIRLPTRTKAPNPFLKKVAKRESPDMDAIESLATEIHKVYCKYHRDVRGQEYWTKGDYDLLDEDTKEADRYMARFIIQNFFRRKAD